MLKGLQGSGLRPDKVSDGRDGKRREVGDGAGLSYRDLVERVPAVLYVDESDEASSAVYMSPQCELLLGYPRQEWLEDPELWVKTLHPEDRERVLAAHRRARRSGGPFAAEYRLVARDGSIVWVRDEAAPDGGKGPKRRMGVLLDITGRKEAEEALKNSEERYRLVARATGEAIWDNDLRTGRQEWDGATEALFGYPPHEGRTGAWWEGRIHPEDRERVLSGLNALLEGDGEAWKEEYRFRRADSSHAHVIDQGYVVRDERGIAVRMVGSMRDVTERREHENELKRSEELFRKTFEAAAVGMAHVALDGRWLRINEKLCEISGHSHEELLGMSYLDLTLPEDAAAGEDRVRRLLEGETGAYSVERRYVRKDGLRRWVNLSVSLVRTPSGKPDYIVCVVEDVTARKLGELLTGPLTPVEARVLDGIVAKRKNREMAEDLHYSVSAIKLQVRNILGKLRVRSRTEAARRAVEIGLARPRADRVSTTPPHGPGAYRSLP